MKGPLLFAVYNQVKVQLSGRRALGGKGVFGGGGDWD